MGPVGPWTHPMVLSQLVLGYIIEINILSRWQNSHMGPLTYGTRAIMVGKAMWKPLELLLSSKTVNPKHCHIHGEMRQSSVPWSRTWRRQRWWFPQHRHSTLPCGPVQKTDGFGRVTVDYWKFNHVVIPLASAVPVVVSLLEKINISLVRGM